VLDQEHGNAAPVADGADLIGQPIDFRVVEPAGRFVQQQQFWTFGERAGKLHPLADSERQGARRTIRNVLEAEFLDQCVGVLDDLLFLAPRERRGERIAQESAARHRMRADAHVLAHRHGRKQSDVLERSRNAERGELMPRAAQQRTSVEHDRSCARIIEARDAIEERRLAGAVRTNQAADRPAGDLEGDIIERGHAAEPDRQPPDRQEGGRLEVRIVIRAFGFRLGQLHGLSVPFTTGSSRPADGRSLDVSRVACHLLCY
jgi:hypothetical protein